MDNWIVSVLFLAMLWLFVQSILGSIHPKAPVALRRMINLIFKLTVIWPAKGLVAGARNFLWPPYDEIHDEPPPRLHNPGNRGDRP